MLRALGRCIDTDAWIWLCDRPGQRSSGRPTSPAGTTRRWLDTSRDAGALEHRQLRRSTTIASTPGTTPYSTTETAEEALARALAAWGSPALRAEHRAELLDFARRAEKPIDRRLAAGPLPGDAPERAAAADRRQPRPDPAMSRADRCTAAATTTPAPSCCARPPPRPARGCRRSSRGCREPAGTGLSRRSFLSRSAGLALAVYGASKIPLAAFEDGDRPGGRRPTRSSSRSSSTAASTRSACSPRSATRATRSCARTWRCRPAPAPPSAEDPSLQLAPRGGGAGDPARRGQGQRLPGDRLRPPRPVPLHLAPLLRDRRARRSASAPAGWAATSTSVGDDDNPLQGLSMDGSLSPMIATAEKPVAAIDSVDGYDLWSRGRRPGRDEMFSSFARFGSLPSDSPALAQVRRATAQTDKLRERPRRRRRLHQPGRLSRTPTSPTSSPASPPIIAVGLPMRVVTIRAAGGYDTHSDQADDLDRNLQRDLRRAARLPARPRGARPRRPGPDRDVERVRPPARRRTARPGTDHGAAGCAFVIGSQSQGRRWSASSPAWRTPRRQRQPARDRATSAAMYCSLLEQWLDIDAGAIIPGAAGFAPHTLVD